MTTRTVHKVSWRARTLLAVILGLCASCAEAKEDGAPPADQHARPMQPSSRVWLEAAGKHAAEQDVHVRFVRGADTQAPRVMDLRLRHADMDVLHVEPGDSLTAAGKQLTVQQRSPGLVRLVALSAESTQGIESGILVTLRVRARAGGEPTLEIDDGQAIFAPATAAAGLSLGDRLTF